MLTYRFKKREIEDGFYVCKPNIIVEIEGFQFFPILDSGCDVTVISESLADAFNVKKGEKTELMAFRETCTVYRGKLNLRFISRNQRFDEVIQVPCLIVPKEKAFEEDAELVIGVAGVFEQFKVTFDLPKKKITMERTRK